MLIAFWPAIETINILTIETQSHIAAAFDFCFTMGDNFINQIKPLYEFIDMILRIFLRYSRSF